MAVYQHTKREYVDRLATNEKRYALAFNGTNEGLWDWDLANNHIFLSNAMIRLTGLSNDIPHPSQVLDVFFERMHPDDRARVRAAIQSHLSSNTPYDVEYRLRMPDGHYHWFQGRGQAVRDEQGHPVRFVGAVGDVHDRVQLQQQLRRAALVDRLTLLPNRSAVLTRLRSVLQARRRGEGSLFAVLFLDFDRFKIVNDSLGHEVGDALLVQIAVRLRENLRKGDQVLTAGTSGSAARIGGDEFVVLLEGLGGPEDAEAIARRLLDVLAEPYELNSFRVVSTASIGIALGGPTYKRAEDLLRDADTAMYEAKAACRGGLAVFDESMRLRVRRRMQLEQGLRAAIDGDQLTVAFQPIICLKTGRVISLEALRAGKIPSLDGFPRWSSSRLQRNVD